MKNRINRFCKFSIIAGIILVLSSQALTGEPNIAIENPAENISVQGEIWINASISDPDGWEIEKAQFRLNNSTGNFTKWTKLNKSDNNFESYASSFNTSKEEDGLYNISIRAEADGDVSKKTLRNISISNIIQDDGDITIFSPEANKVVEGVLWTNASFDESLEGEVSQTFRWTNSTGNQTSWIGFNSTVNTSELSDGVYNITFNVSEDSGLVETDTQPNITVNNTFSRNISTPPNISEVSLESQETVSGNIRVSAVIFDEDNISDRRYRWSKKGWKTSWRDLNDTYNTERLRDGIYNLTVFASDRDESDNDSSRLSQNINVLNEDGSIPEICCSYTKGLADDRKLQTLTSYRTPLAFKSNLITSDSYFNISGPLGQDAETINNIKELDAKGLREGRYAVEAKGENQQMDIVSSGSDVVGRTLQQSDISILHWYNGSEVSDDKYSLKTVDWFSGQLFRLNTSLERYWIESSNNTYSVMKPSRLATDLYNNHKKISRLNDLALDEPSSIEGRISDENGNNVSGAVLSLKRISNERVRYPYLTYPKSRLETTGEDGAFNFTGLASGVYRLELENDSLVRDNFRELRGKKSSYISLNSSKIDVGEIGATSRKGDVLVDINGNENKQIDYGVLVDGIENSYYKPGVGPKFTGKVSVPKGNYTVKVYRFRRDGLSISHTSLQKEVHVKQGEETALKFSFNEKVPVTGNITIGEKPVGNVAIRAVNRTKNLEYTTKTSQDGSYKLDVENNTVYRLETGPRNHNPETVIKNVSGNVSVNFNFTEKVKIQGSILGSETFEGYLEVLGLGEMGKADIDSNKSFSLNGLNKSSTYAIKLKSPLGTLKEFNLKTGSDDGTRDISVSEGIHDLNISVKNEEDQHIQTNVEILSDEGSFNKNIGFKENFTVKNLSEDVYTIRAKLPDRRPLQKKIRLDEDKSVSFSYHEVSNISGVLRNSKDERVPFQRIKFSSEGNNYLESTVTDAGGEYEIKLPYGTYTVDRVSKNSRKSLGTIDHSEENQDLFNFSIGSSNYLAGEVYLGGSRVSEGYVVAWNKTKGEKEYSAIKQGEFNITGLSKEGYTVFFKTNGNELDVARKEVAPSNLNQKIKIDVEERKGPEIKVYVSDQSKNSLENAQVKLKNLNRVTGQNGEVKFPRVKDGKTYTLHVSKEGYKTKSKDFKADKVYNDSTGFKQYQDIQEVGIELEEVKENPHDVDILLRKAGEEEGRASIVFEPKDKGLRTRSALTDSTGRTRIESLREGNYSVALSGSGQEVEDFWFRGTSANPGFEDYYMEVQVDR